MTSIINSLSKYRFDEYRQFPDQLTPLWGKSIKSFQDLTSHNKSELNLSTEITDQYPHLIKINPCRKKLSKSIVFSQQDQHRISQINRTNQQSQKTSNNSSKSGKKYCRQNTIFSDLKIKSPMNTSIIKIDFSCFSINHLNKSLPKPFKSQIPEISEHSQKTKNNSRSMSNCSSDLDIFRKNVSNNSDLSYKLSVDQPKASSNFGPIKKRAKRNPKFKKFQLERDLESNYLQNFVC